MDPDVFEERKDLLILAQQKLDEMNRTNLGLRQSSSSRVSRPGSAQGRGGRGTSSPLTTHLLSTLLYMALMSHKLEDMKIMLEVSDGPYAVRLLCVWCGHQPPLLARGHRALCGMESFI